MEYSRAWAVEKYYWNQKVVIFENQGNAIEKDYVFKGYGSLREKGEDVICIDELGRVVALMGLDEINGGYWIIGRITS